MLSFFHLHSSSLQLDAAVRDGKHDAIFRAFERDGKMRGTGFVDDVIARYVPPARVLVAALKNEDLFDAVMLMRRVSASGLHSDQHGRIACLLIAAQGMNKYSLMSCCVPIDLFKI